MDATPKFVGVTQRQQFQRFQNSTEFLHIDHSLALQLLALEKYPICSTLISLSLDANNSSIPKTKKHTLRLFDLVELGI